MKLDESLPQTDGDRPPKENELYSTDWWANRTPEELRDIIGRGFSGGPAFEGAVAEAERRARAETSRVREEAVAEAEHRKDRRRTVMVPAAVVVALVILVAVVVWLL